MRYVVNIYGLNLKDRKQLEYLLASVFGDSVNVLQEDDLGDGMIMVCVSCNQKAGVGMVLGLGSDVSFSYRELV